MLKNKVLVITGLLVSLFFTEVIVNPNAIAQNLQKVRAYEPVVVRGDLLSGFYDTSVDEIFMYVYLDSTNQWQLIPFQFDEMANAVDPFKPNQESTRQDFYFVETNGILDLRDELAFMVQDLGDKAPSNSWIENDDSKNYPRIELKISDPDDPSLCAYGYLYRSATIQDEVPAPYNFSFEQESHTVDNRYYSVRMSKQNGLIEDVIIKPPFGTGIDIFDTQKIRFVGVFDFGIVSIPVGKNGQSAANERDNLYVYNEDDGINYHLGVTKKPVVRLIREVRQTINFGTWYVDEAAFYVTTKFYPFSGTIGGGANLDPETLQKELGFSEDIYINLDLLRESWDYNNNATGMKFYNKYNDGVLIDGNPDQVDKTVTAPINEWMLVSGDQGSMFSYVAFNDTSWQSTDLYFYDDKNGGQGDDTVIRGGDTGDSLSYGDQGILFHNLDNDSVSLELGFTGYFLPGNLSKADGEQMAHQIENPVVKSSQIQSFISAVENINSGNYPNEIVLYQNYPNPFNNHTRLTFYLPSEKVVNLAIYDVNGRLVKMINSGSLDRGVHQFSWDGTNEVNQTVSSGVYFYKLQTDYLVKTRKLILIQ